MDPVVVTPAVAADAGPVAELIAALESSRYGQSGFSQADLVDEWSDVDLEHNARVVRAGDRVVGYGAVRERGERWDAEGRVHPDALGRGIGKLIATGLEQHAARRGACKIHSSVLEADSAGRRLLESLGYGAVRVFRELRIELDAPPPALELPGGLRIVAFDPELDAREFHAAEDEAFTDHWEYTPHPFEAWSKEHLASERFDPRRLVRRTRGRRACRRDDLFGRYVRGWLGPSALYASPVAQEGRRDRAPPRVIQAPLGAR
jgi:GNAT superfamily N-acetyltransferase